MAAVLTTFQAKDASNVTKDFPVADESGTGAGPLTPIHSGRPITETDRSGTITTGGTAQQACAANSVRRLLYIHNPDVTTDLFFNTTGTATTGAGSSRLGPGGSILWDIAIPTGAVSVLSATTGKPYTIKES